MKYDFRHISWISLNDNFNSDSCGLNCFKNSQPIVKYKYRRKE